MQFLGDRRAAEDIVELFEEGNCLNELCMATYRSFRVAGKDKLA